MFYISCSLHIFGAVATAGGRKINCGPYKSVMLKGDSECPDENASLAHVYLLCEPALAAWSTCPHYRDLYSQYL